MDTSNELAQYDTEGCGDPDCAYCYDASETFESWIGFSEEELTLGDTVNSAVEEAYQRGYQNGMNDGARAALDNAEVDLDNPVYTFTEAAMLDILNEDLSTLEVELEEWVPEVDVKLEDHKECLIDHAEGIDALEVNFTMLSELTATILTGQDARIKELEEQTEADAIYLDSLGELFQSLAVRMDRVERVTGANAFQL